jgi:hypothetical protein
MSKLMGSVQPAYLPWSLYFKRIQISDYFVILDNVQFVKNSFHNKNYILGNGKLIRLTVPVIHKFGQKLCEVKIDNTKNWKSKHWRSIIQCYSKTPYFSIIKDDLHKIYLKDWDKLSELNIEIILLFAKYLKLDKRIYIASQLPIDTKKNSNLMLINYCNFFGADTFIVKPDTEHYHPKIFFEKFKIKFNYFNLGENELKILELSKYYDKNKNISCFLSYLHFFCNHGTI